MFLGCNLVVVLVPQEVPHPVAVRYLFSIEDKESYMVKPKAQISISYW